MQDQESNEQSFRLRHWGSLQINLRIQHARQLWLFDNKTPNLTMVFGDREQISHTSSFRLFVQSVTSRKKAGNDSDALKNVEPMFGYEMSYPIVGNYTAAVGRREWL